MTSAGLALSLFVVACALALAAPLTRASSQRSQPSPTGAHGNSLATFKSPPSGVQLSRGIDRLVSMVPVGEPKPLKEDSSKNGNTNDDDNDDSNGTTSHTATIKVDPEDKPRILKGFGGGFLG